LWEIRQNQGRLGVFWHTQGSGKSFSMVFFAQKVLRKIPGNWTFVVVTDRDDLDNQIYRNFRNCGAATEECQAESGEHLKQLLTEDHRFVFTLIQKFGTKEGRQYPKLSDRQDIILMTDEAHRSQYDTLALNMRNALPKAAFIGFTGTPLMAGEEQTRQVFGDYVSIYNFRQSLEDKATVPLFYENRVPELQLTNENLKDDLETLIDQAELTEDQQKKLERVFAREYHLITRDDRLEKIAEDLVAHFLGREQGGKGMVICIDKLTAVRMYEKVQRHWKAHLADLQAELPLADDTRRPTLAAQIEFLKTTDMAVVISSQQNEVDEFKKRGIDIKPHRERMVREDLETKFKNPDDPFRLVFVCAMWLTGFDAPCVSTVYLDKPMKNHTLMQTIARANRVFREKYNGLIVDYVGVFRDLQRALSIYGAAEGGDGQPGDSPIQSKDELVAALKVALAEALAFCEERGVVLTPIVESTGFQRIAHLEDAATRLVDKTVADAVDDSVEKIIVNDELKKRFLSLVDHVVRVYKAILPDPKANEFAPLKTCLAVLAEKIRGFGPEVDIGEVMEQVEQLLDNSIATMGYVIHATEKTSPIDLGEIDFEALKEHFEKSRKRTEAEKLKGAIQRKLAELVRKNKTRVELGEKLKKLIDEYNKGQDVDGFFAKLLNFARELTAEERRGVAEQLSEEELAVFDILTRPAPEMSAAERKQVKEVARKLLQTLKQAKLVLDWRQRLRTRADVLATVKTILDDLPRVYTKELYEEKCDTVWQHVYDSYFGEGESVYGRV
ncbi:MAG: type I restriction endonuclease subunit R, partial [Planctomycetaceae bacterium]